MHFISWDRFGFVAYIICQHDQILIFCIFPSESLFLPSHAYFDFLYDLKGYSISLGIYAGHSLNTMIFA